MRGFANGQDWSAQKVTRDNLPADWKTAYLDDSKMVAEKTESIVCVPRRKTGTCYELTCQVYLQPQGRRMDDSSRSQ